MRNTSPVSDAIMAALLRHPEGMFLQGIAEETSSTVHNTARAVGHLNAKEAIRWVRDRGPYAPHRCRLFHPEHAPANAKKGKPGLVQKHEVHQVLTIRAKADPLTLEAGPVDTSKARRVVCPAGMDFRFTVRELPKGYVSALNPGECRPWANVAAQARAA